MSAHKFVAGIVGVAAVVAGAVAIAHSSADTNVSSFSKARPLVATCPKIDWPYGCNWRAEAISGAKHLATQKSKHKLLYTSFLGKRVHSSAF